MNDECQISTNKISVFTKRIALIGVLFALTIVLSLIEAALPIPTPVPGIKLGLSNIVVMYSIFFLKFKDALAIAVLKSIFIFLMRGIIAGILSMCGGLFSLGIMALIFILFKNKASFLIISILGAIFHNLGQMVAASYLLNTTFWFYLPILLFSGIIAGFATSVLLKITIPFLSKLNKK
ncbi:MAG: hypothetical protein A2Y15_01715 [Clostridiales bacterium GWF2_36_10]|nr:MAG: hypothetical protein A2Y15_01715 [Clostridiales bacterium GWF2_36_10]